MSELVGSLSLWSANTCKNINNSHFQFQAILSYPSLGDTVCYSTNHKAILPLSFYLKFCRIHFEIKSIIGKCRAKYLIRYKPTDIYTLKDCPLIGRKCNYWKKTTILNHKRNKKLTYFFLQMIKIFSFYRFSESNTFMSNIAKINGWEKEKNINNDLQMWILLAFLLLKIFFNSPIS